MNYRKALNNQEKRDCLWSGIYASITKKKKAVVQFHDRNFKGKINIRSYIISIYLKKFLGYFTSGLILVVVVAVFIKGDVGLRKSKELVRLKEREIKVIFDTSYDNQKVG